MKKIVWVVLMVAGLAGAAFGAERITAQEAFRIAVQAANDPIVGVWRMHPRSGGRIAHMAIVPNTTNKRQNWSYLGIMLEDGFEIKKNGIKIALRQTNFERTYDVILSNRANESGDVYSDGGGFAFLNGNILDMHRVEVPHREIESLYDDDDRYPPIIYMIKVRDFRMDTTDQKFTPSGLSFDGISIKAVGHGSIADRAGLQPGDVIVEINGRTASEKVLEDIDARLTAGRSVVIAYERGGKKDLVTLKW